MDKFITAFFCICLFCSSLSLAKVNPAQSPDDLEAQVTVPGNEDLSVMTNTEGLGKLHTGLEPYLPVDSQYSLPDEENGLYIRSAEGPATGDESDTGDATER